MDIRKRNTWAGPARCNFIDPTAYVTRPLLDDIAGAVVDLLKRSPAQIHTLELPLRAMRPC